MTDMELDRFAPLVAALGTDGYGAAVLALLHDDLGICHVTAFEQSMQGGPRCVTAAGCDSRSTATSRQLSAEYVGDAWQRDPLLPIVRDLATDLPQHHCFDALRERGRRDPDPAYLDHFYIAPRLGEEVVLCQRRGGRLLWMELYRPAGAAPFRERDRRCIAQMQKLLLATAWRQADDGTELPPPAPGPDEALPAPPMDDWDGATRTQLLERVRTGLLMAPHGLTLREADICAHVAMGYGALAVSLLLGISIHTVHTHRKRAYRKLGVSSQTELFNSVLRACLSRA